MIKKFAGFLVFLTGLLIIAGGAWYAFEATRFLNKTESTTGTVVEHERKSGLNSSFREVGSSNQTGTISMFTPIVEFETATGAIVQFRANWSEGDPPAVGASVPVRYLTQFPEDARIGGLFSLYGAAVILLLIGGVFAFAGWLILRKSV